MTILVRVPAGRSKRVRTDSTICPLAPGFSVAQLAGYRRHQRRVSAAQRASPGSQVAIHDRHAQRLETRGQDIGQDDRSGQRRSIVPIKDIVAGRLPGRDWVGVAELLHAQVRLSQQPGIQVGQVIRVVRVVGLAVGPGVVLQDRRVGRVAVRPGLRLDAHQQLQRGGFAGRTAARGCRPAACPCCS